MSIKLMTAVWAREDLTSTQKLVLLALADWSNDEGLSWPSIDQLMKKSSLKKRAVQITIRSLEESGFVRREEVTGKGNRYWITLPVHQMHHCTTFTPPVHQMHPTPAPNAPNTSEIHQGNINSIVDLPIDDPNTVSENDVLEAWNDLAKDCGLPTIKKLNATRKRQLKARLKENTLDEWKQAFAAIERSPFLRGENKTGWRASFDFLLQPSSFTKLIEGQYDQVTR